MEHTKRAEERREKLAKKLAPEAMQWIEQRAEELAKSDLLSSLIRTKHMNEAYEQWKHEQEISPEEALAHEAEPEQVALIARLVVVTRKRRRYVPCRGRSRTLRP